MATQPLADSIVSFLRPTSLLGRSNFVKRKLWKLLDFRYEQRSRPPRLPNEFLVVPDQTPRPTASSLLYSRKMSPNKLQGLLQQAPFIGRLPHETQLQGFIDRFPPQDLSGKSQRLAPNPTRTSFDVAQNKTASL
jgi:hypothetical protein